MKKVILSLAFLSVIYAFSHSQIIEITDDTIRTNTTWSDTIKILKDLTIDYQTTLTIDSGTVIEFLGHHKINVKGTILAYGTPEDSIIFTVTDTNDFHNLEIENGGWDGIHYDNYDFTMWGEDTSVFRFCRFEFSKAIGEFNTARGGAMFIRNFGFINLDNCYFYNNAAAFNGGAVCIEGDIEPAFFHCIFEKNTANIGGAIRIEYLSRPFFYNCRIYENYAADAGGGISSNGISYILNCTIFKNYSNNVGGGLDLANARDRIIGCQINNNFSGHGGGVWNHAAWPEFYNNTLCYNHAKWSGGGMAFNNLINANFFNNLIWGNTIGEFSKDPEQVSILGSTSTPNFYSCIIEGGIEGISDYKGNYDNILSIDPDFNEVPTGSGPDADGSDIILSLEPTSPAINQGSNLIKDKLLVEHDLLGQPRILHGILDIGAVETAVGSFAVSDTILENTTWIADTVRVTGDIIVKDSITLTVAPGTCVEFQDSYKFEVIGTVKAKGMQDFPIKFTRSDTTGYATSIPDSGSWKGIIFDNSNNGANAIMNDNDSSVFRYCNIEYVKNYLNDWTIARGGAFRIKYFSRLEIAHCTIQYNKAYSGAGICVDLSSHPYIHNNTIYRNYAVQEGGGMSVLNNSNPRIIANYIINNATTDTTLDTWGGGLKLYFSDPVLINNIICNNYSKLGGGLQVDNSNPVFVNNTVCNNRSFHTAGGMELYKSKSNIINCIFRGNTIQDSPFAKNQIHIQEDINFYHNNIEGGAKNIYPWWYNYNGEYIANIDSDPYFKKPTEGSGIDYDALHADWSLTDYSMNINKGHPESYQFNLPDRDIAGKRRYNHEIIDIGAYENQGEPVFIIREPNNQFACTGDTIEFSVELEGKAMFQWLKDGEKIEGADTNVLSIDSVSLGDRADYICVIKNGYGLLLSNNVTLEVNAPPEILLQTESQWVKEDASLKLEIHGRGTEPIHYTWIKNGDLVQEEEQPEFRIKSMSYEDEGTYFCHATNVCGETASDPITLFVAPQICMVTVDLETGDNLIIWEKRGAAPISAYNVYRESIVAGEYEPIGNVSADALSIFLDTEANPETQAYIYKITALDDEGNESDIALCKPHKTIHLLTTINLATGATQLDWDHYYGFTYGTFHIYRSLTESNFGLLESKSSSTTEYTDPNPENNLYYYRVSVDRPEDCSPTGEGKKAGSGPYSHSMSNTEDNRLQQTDIDELQEIKEITISPNPFNDYSTLRFPNPGNRLYIVRVFDLSGKIVKTAEVRSAEFRLYRDNLENGYYIIELQGDEIFRSNLIIE